MPTVNGHVFKQTRIQPAVAIIEGRQNIAVVFVRVEHPVEVRILSIKDGEVHAVNKPQFGNRFKRGILAQIRWLLADVGLGLRPARGAVVG